MGGSAGKYSEPLSKLLNENSVASKPISADFKDMPIGHAIRIIARAANKGVIIAEGLNNKNVTFFVPNVQFDQVMKTLSMVGNFTMKEEGNIIVIAPAEKNIPSVNSDGTINLNVKDTSIPELMQYIGQVGKINIITHKNVRGNISIKLDNVTPLEALRLIAKASDLYVDKDGNNYLVMYSSNLLAVTGKTNQAVIPLKYMEPTEAIVLLNHAKIPGGEIVDKERAVKISGDPSIVEKAREILLSQDKPQKPVRIEMKFWQITNPEGYKTDEFSKKSDKEREQSAKLLLSPKILAVPGQPASIKVGSMRKSNGNKWETLQENGDLKAVRINKHPENKDEDVSFEIKMLPRILPNDMVQFDVDGTIEITMANSGGEPLVQKRKWNSSFVVKPGVHFTHEIQGSGNSPVVADFLLTRPDAN